MSKEIPKSIEGILKSFSSNDNKVSLIILGDDEVLYDAVYSAKSDELANQYATEYVEGGCILKRGQRIKLSKHDGYSPRFGPYHKLELLKDVKVRDDED